MLCSKGLTSSNISISLDHEDLGGVFYEQQLDQSGTSCKELLNNSIEPYVAQAGLRIIEIFDNNRVCSPHNVDIGMGNFNQ